VLQTLVISGLAAHQEKENAFRQSNKEDMRLALQKAMISSKSNEWATPQDFFDELDEEFHFTLDPCSTHENCKCERHYTIEEDGLSKGWAAHTVFANPPYGGNVAPWIKKAYDESKKGATVVCLITSSTDRSYWHDYIFPYAAQIRFIRGRLKFGNSKSGAPFASAVVIFSDKIKYIHKICYYGESVSMAKRHGRKQVSVT